MDHSTLIVEAAKKQKYTGFYDVHLHLPLTMTKSQPYGTAAGAQTVNLSVRLPANIKQELEEIGAKYNLPVNQLVKNAIVYAVDLQKDREEAATLDSQRYSGRAPVTYHMKNDGETVGYHPPGLLPLGDVYANMEAEKNANE